MGIIFFNLVPIGALTITASTTGDFDSGTLTDDVAADSKCNILDDTNASSSGTGVWGGYVEIEIRP